MLVYDIYIVFHAAGFMTRNDTQSMKIHYTHTTDHIRTSPAHSENASEWSLYSPGDIPVTYLNRLNQAFVDLVRSTGGKNPTRHSLIAGYWTDIQKTCNNPR